jgi:TetR/AcrR family transcriptional repressor of nem operon
MQQTTSEKILDVAQALIVAGGYNGFSYADISDTVGIRKASIHHHFPTKAELVSVLLERYAKQAETGLAFVAANIENPADQLQAYIGHWQTCILDASEPFCVCAMLASEIQLLPEDVASRVRRHFENLSQWLASVLKAGAEQGIFRLAGAPQDEAQILMASVHGAMLSARAFANPDIFTAIVGPQMARIMVQQANASH